MTGRTCKVHGEYSETGICRWCEPLPAPDASPPLPEGHTRCRCGWMAWTEYAPRPFRGEYNGMIHSPEQCYATAATPPAEPVTAFTWKDGARVCNVDETTLKPGISVFDAMVEGWARIVRARIHDDMAEARYFPFDATRCSPRLLAQHAALRWERVARRLATKHGRWTIYDLSHLWRQQFNKVLARSLKQLEESLHPLLPAPKEPKP